LLDRAPPDFDHRLLAGTGRGRYADAVVEPPPVLAGPHPGEVQQRRARLAARVGAYRLHGVGCVGLAGEAAFDAHAGLGDLAHGMQRAHRLRRARRALDFRLRGRRHLRAGSQRQQRQQRYRPLSTPHFHRPASRQEKPHGASAALNGRASAPARDSERQLTHTRRSSRKR